MTTKIPTNNYVTHYDPNKNHHRAWLQAVLDRLLELDPKALDDGGELRTLWKAAVETKPPAPIATAINAYGSVKPAVKRLLELIYAGEGGYDSYNRGKAGDSPGGWPGGLQRLTVGEVMKLQADRKVFAVGAAQFIPSTLQWAVNQTGIPLSASFNAETQDRLAQALLLGGKRPALRDYLLGRRGDVAAAQTDLALEWASIPGPNGKGMYDGDQAGNRAHGDVDRVQAALREAQAALVGQSAPVAGAAGSSNPINIAGMIGPTKKPQQFGFKAGDTHLLVNDDSERITAFDHLGKVIWDLPCLARGQGGDNQWKRVGEDTPPGLYKLGQTYNDWSRYGTNAPRNRDTLSYGWLSFDMVELEGQEARYGRAGIMLHGGGTACGWPGAWSPMQALHPTLGCVRMHNVHLRDHVLPLTKKGTVFISVFQEQ